MSGNQNQYSLMIMTQIAFAALPIHQIQKVRSFGKGLVDYWLHCWQTDSFGNTFVPMRNEDLNSTTKAKYRKLLQQLHLFIFEVRYVGKIRTIWVRNLFGSKSNSFRYPINYPLCDIEKSLDIIEPSIEQNKKLDVENEVETPQSQCTTTVKSYSTSTQEKLKINNNKTNVEADKKLSQEEEEILLLIKSELDVSEISDGCLKLVKNNPYDVVKKAIAYVKKKMSNGGVSNVSAYLTTVVKNNYGSQAPKSKRQNEFDEAYQQLIDAGIVKDVPVSHLNIRMGETMVCVIDSSERGYYDLAWREALLLL